MGVRYGVCVDAGSATAFGQNGTDGSVTVTGNKCAMSLRPIANLNTRSIFMATPEELRKEAEQKEKEAKEKQKEIEAAEAKKQAAENKKREAESEIREAEAEKRRAGGTGGLFGL